MRELQSHGISILGSTIIGLEEHTPENLPDAIEHAVAHDTEFHQFMLYTPVAGTPLFEEHRKNGTLLDPECKELADTHGQLRFAHKHPHTPRGMEGDFLLQAFARGFEVNGPSIVRVARATLRGWRKYGKGHPDKRVRARFRRESETLRREYPAVLWAARQWYRDEMPVFQKMDELLREVLREFGWQARLVASLGGPMLFRKHKAEAQRPAEDVLSLPLFANARRRQLCFSGLHRTQLDRRLLPMGRTVRTDLRVGRRPKHQMKTRPLIMAP